MKPFGLHFTQAEATGLLAEIPEPALRAFRIGVATGGFQCEGGFNGAGEPLNNWWMWEGRTGVAASRTACRFWDKFNEDIQILSGCGLSVLRFSIEWARVAPCRDPAQRGRAEIDQGAILRYAEMFEALQRAGIEAVVTLYHWTHPANLGVDLWLQPDSPGIFADYVVQMLGLLLTELERRGVSPPARFITVNEPNMVPLNTYFAGRFPHGPGQQGGAAAARCMQNLLLAHLEATRRIRDLYLSRGLPEPAISFNNNFSAFYRADAFFVDLLLAPTRGVDRGQLQDHLRGLEHRFTTEFLASEGEISPLRRAARWGVRGVEALLRQGVTLERFEPLVAAAYAFDAPPLDYLAFDYYDPFPWNLLGKSTPGSDRGPSPIVDEWDWKPHPRGLSVALQLYSSSAPLPLWVMENGMATRAIGTKGFPRRDGARRDLFLRAHLLELFRAKAGGAPVEGYLHWSLWDNYEWGSYQPRFGLMGMDAAAGDVERRRLDAAGVPSLEALGAISRAARAGDGHALARQLARYDIGPAPAEQG